MAILCLRVNMYNGKAILNLCMWNRIGKTTKYGGKVYNTVHCVGYCTLYYTLNCKVCIVVICCCSASSTSLLIPHSSYLKPHTPSYSLILHTSYLIPHTPSYFFILHTSYLIPRFFDSLAWNTHFHTTHIYQIDFLDT